MRQRNRWQFALTVLVLTAFLVGFGVGAPSVRALSLGGALGTVVKTLGIGYVVTRYGGSIDVAINGMLRQRQAQIEGKTKVVPILRVGGGSTAVGAAQVMGPAQQVDKVEAVAELEWNPTGAVRGRALIPVSTRDTSSVKGVGGVGVSANIKVPL